MSDKQIRKTRLYNRDQVIQLKNSENPRRKGSNRAAIFEVIQDGMTVHEFLELTSEWNGGTKDLQLLAESGHVAVLPALSKEEPPSVTQSVPHFIKDSMR